ncbi:MULTISPECIES: hypothetical protein [unclassified Leifsonia]|uniref:hypothetical protein n=1 Tax=unclassified Leifsonia TaxID=2663824 RepID=UPI000AE4B5CD|nr:MULTISPECIES: hypothetical protein [unclassified Leifsonia]
MAIPEPPAGFDTAVRAVLSTIPYFGGAIEIVYTDVRDRRAEKAAELVAVVQQAVGEQTFLERLSTDPRLERVFVDAVESAVRTSIRAKRRVLAGAVVNAARDSGQIDQSELILDALASLEVQHVRALARLSDEWDAVVAVAARAPNSDRPSGWGTSAVWRALPEPIRAALVRTGTAKPSPTAYGATIEPRRNEGITDFGLDVVARLRVEGWDAEAVANGWNMKVGT